MDDELSYQSASCHTSFLDQQVGGTIQSIELRIPFAHVLWIKFLCEWRRQVPNGAMRIDLQHIKSPALPLANNVDAEHTALGKCFVSALTQRNDLGVVADEEKKAHFLAIRRDHTARIGCNVSERREWWAHV